MMDERYFQNMVQRLGIEDESTITRLRFEFTMHKSDERQKIGGLRDQFAMAALTGLLTQERAMTEPYHNIASTAYDAADAMLKARESE